MGARGLRYSRHLVPAAVLRRRCLSQTLSLSLVRRRLSPPLSRMPRCLLGRNLDRRCPACLRSFDAASLDTEPDDHKESSLIETICKRHSLLLCARETSTSCTLCVSRCADTSRGTEDRI